MCQIPAVTLAKIGSRTADQMIRQFQNRQIPELLSYHFLRTCSFPSSSSAGLVLSAPQSEGRNTDHFSAIILAQDGMAAMLDLR